MCFYVFPMLTDPTRSKQFGSVKVVLTNHRQPCCQPLRRKPDLFNGNQPNLHVYSLKLRPWKGNTLHLQFFKLFSLLALINTDLKMHQQSFVDVMFMFRYWYSKVWLFKCFQFYQALQLFCCCNVSFSPLGVSNSFLLS